jgi:hypothetical protein
MRRIPIALLSATVLGSPLLGCKSSAVALMGNVRMLATGAHGWRASHEPPTGKLHGFVC